jgi:hypothetical protein
MHVQAKSAPALSPPDLVAFLQVLAADEKLDRKAINIEGVTGSAVEDGGQLVFTVTHGRAHEAHERLREAGYAVQWTTDLYAEKIPPNQGSGSSQDDPNRPGVLLGIVERAKEHVNAGGRGIDTVLIGAFTDKPGRFFCQCTWVGADWQGSPPDDEGDDD